MMAYHASKSFKPVSKNAPGVTATAELLTPTQLKVLEGVCYGLPNKQIAFSLGICEGTVKGHVTVLLRKLSMTNRTQMALFAREASLV